jgi:hypothetical protein
MKVMISRMWIILHCTKVDLTSDCKLEKYMGEKVVSWRNVPVWKYIRIGGSKVPPRSLQKCSIASPFTEHMLLYSEHICISCTWQICCSVPRVSGHAVPTAVQASQPGME